MFKKVLKKQYDYAYYMSAYIWAWLLAILGWRLRTLEEYQFEKLSMVIFSYVMLSLLIIVGYFVVSSLMVKYTIIGRIMIHIANEDIAAHNISCIIATIIVLIGILIPWRDMLIVGMTVWSCLMALVLLSMNKAFHCPWKKKH